MREERGGVEVGGQNDGAGGRAGCVLCGTASSGVTDCRCQRSAVNVGCGRGCRVSSSIQAVGRRGIELDRGYKELEKGARVFLLCLAEAVACASFRLSLLNWDCGEGSPKHDLSSEGRGLRSRSTWMVNRRASIYTAVAL